MSGPIRAALLFLLASAASLAGCKDPNPTFVFDAAPAPAVKDAASAGSMAGSGGNGGNGGSGGNGGGDSGDAGVEAAGGSL